MGDISVIARRLKDGHVQYGWSGNGGYYKMLGNRLLCWYDEKDDDLIEYLFGLGQFSLLGRPESEKGGASKFETHALTGTPHYLGKTEREIFSKIVFIDYGYFYDLDCEWYYIKPGPFRIKIPLALIHNNLDDDDYEFDFLSKLEKDILHYLFYDYGKTDEYFNKVLDKKDVDGIYGELLDSEHSIYDFWEKYREIFSYFDDWIVIRCDDNYEQVTDIVMRKKEEPRVETNEWLVYNG